MITTLRVSSARIASGKADIPFDRQQLAHYRDAATLSGIFEIASRSLDASERARFKMAYAAKMLQWIEGRNLSPERDDCAFIGRAYGERTSFSFLLNR